MAFFLGADGGQTDSIALLSDGAGQVLAVSRAGPSNHIDEPGGPERFRRTLHQLVTEAFTAAGQPLQPLSGACFGLTGAWERAAEVVRALVAVDHLLAVEDTVTAQAGAFAGSPGIVVISGTGSVAYGLDEAGQVARSGGWGYLLGDEGSGYDIGRKALRVAARADDGRGPVTLLTERIPAHFGLADMETVMVAIYSGRISRSEIAGLAVITAQAASEQDAVALRLFDAAAAALAQAVVAVAQRLNWLTPAVSTSGGVFRAGSVILDPFSQALQATLPEATVQPPRYPGVVGALLLALRADGLPPDEATLQRLDQAVRRHGLKI